jgi:hypothetical protein
MAGQLVATTREKCWEPVTSLANKLCEAVKGEPDMFELVSLTTELMQICNSSQESCLEDVPHAKVPALSLVNTGTSA